MAPEAAAFATPANPLSPQLAEARDPCPENSWPKPKPKPPAGLQPRCNMLNPSAKVDFLTFEGRAGRRFLTASHNVGFVSRRLLPKLQDQEGFRGSAGALR